jgi:hypothetical protein
VSSKRLCGGGLPFEIVVLLTGESELAIEGADRADPGRWLYEALLRTRLECPLGHSRAHPQPGGVTAPQSYRGRPRCAAVRIPRLGSRVA